MKQLQIFKHSSIFLATYLLEASIRSGDFYFFLKRKSAAHWNRKILSLLVKMSFLIGEEISFSTSKR
jgi:hypothetical protein